MRNGYFFYVTGTTREGKDPRDLDRKLIEPLRREVSKFTRARRKKAGLANVHYLRHKRFFVLLATYGRHPFFDEEQNVIRDARETPIKYDGYAVSYRAGHACVRIDRGTELNMKAYFADIATKQSAANISRQFRRLPFQPYVPVRAQLLDMLRDVSRRRKAAGLEKVPVTSVRWSAGL